MSLNMRLRAYAPNGAALGLIPTPQTVSASMPFGDVGAMDVAYPASGPKVGLLAGPCEVAVEVSYDNGATWTEPDNARYLRLVRKGDTVEQVPVIAYSGPAYLWTLTKARVLPNGLLNADGKRPFLSATAGTILKTLIQEAQARGALAGLDAASFTPTKDSSGANWSQVVTLYYEPGLDYLTILMNLQAQGLVDFTMSGRSLKVYNGDTVMAGASGATLRKGRDLTEAPFTGTMEGLANYVYLLGDEGASLERTNAGATAPWGRWESFISQGGVRDPGTMAVLTDSSLDLSATERVENTYGLRFDLAAHLPFRNYNLGQDVKVADGQGVPVPLRCRQITLTRDEKGVVAGNVVLNDRFLENEVRQTRRVNGITGGSTTDGGSGARPAPIGTDRMPPARPTVGSYASNAYQDAEGRTYALLTVNVTPVTTNADGTAMDDLAGYEVAYRVSGATTWSAVVQDDDGQSVALPGLQPGTIYELTARAYDTSGNRSTLAPAVAVTTASDAVGPGKPATPTASAYLGQILLGWSGLLSTGAPLPSDYGRMEFHLSTDPAFGAYTVVDSSTSRGPLSTVATGLTYGTTYYVRVAIWDRSGNASPFSDSAQAVPVRAAGADLTSGSVSFDAIAFKQPGNLVPDGRVEDAVYRTALAPAMSPGWALVTGAGIPWSGQWAVQGNGATNPGTAREVWWMADRGLTVPGLAPVVGAYRPTAFACQGTERHLYRMRAKGNLDGGLSLHLTYYDAAGAYVNDYTSTIAGGTLDPVNWVAYSQTFTAPAGAVYCVPSLLMRTDTTTGTVTVDDVEIRPIIGTVLIDDAAITSAKVASLAADKITAGVMNAAVTVSGRIATGLTGARVELNSTGLRAYDPSGVQTVGIGTDGSATFSGVFRTTAANGRSLEISTTPLDNSWGEDGQHSIKWTPTTLTAGWTPAGILPLALTSGANYGSGLIIQGSTNKNAPYTGALINVQMDGLFMRAIGATGAQASVSMYEVSGKSYLDLGQDADNITLGSGAVGVSTRVQGGTLELTSQGSITAFDRDNWLGLRLTKDATSTFFQSQTVYNRTYTGTSNLLITSAAVLGRITSLEATKVAVDRTWADSVALERIKGLTPASYYDRWNAERYATLADDPQADDAPEDAEFPRMLLGLIAEDVEALGLEELVTRDDDGALAGVAYDRLAVALIPWLRNLEARLNALEAAGRPVGSTA